MPFPLDSITRKKLVIVKQLYQQGVDLLPRFTDMSHIMSAISFDLSIETLLKLVMRLADSSKSPKPDLNELIQQIDAVGNSQGLGQVPDKGHINRVRAIRNAAQHEARVPNTTELSESYIYTRDFLNSFVHQVWGIELKDISLVDSLQTVVVKELMIKAEIALNQGDFTETIKQSSIALTWAIRRVRYTFISEPTRNPSANLHAYKSNYGSPVAPKGMENEIWRVLTNVHKDIMGEFKKTADNFNRLRSELLTDIDKTQAILVYTFLNLNYIDFLKHQSIAGKARLRGHEPEEVEFLGAKEHPDKNDAEFVFHYCIDTLVQIEERVGEIVEPPILLKLKQRRKDMQKE